MEDQKVFGRNYVNSVYFIVTLKSFVLDFDFEALDIDFLVLHTYQFYEVDCFELFRCLVSNCKSKQVKSLICVLKYVAVHHFWFRKLTQIQHKFVFNFFHRFSKDPFVLLFVKSIYSNIYHLFCFSELEVHFICIDHHTGDRTVHKQEVLFVKACQVVL